MSRINRDIYTSLDVNGPYIRIDTQPVSTTLNHNGNAVFTLAASTYYLTGDEAEIGDIDTLETDAVAPTDTNLDNLTPGVPHTAKNDGYISYQWYEIDANSNPIGKVTKLSDSTVYTGTTTNTLTVKNVQSPGTHLNQYYCVLDYIPNLTSGQYDTGNAVNDIVNSNTVTLNVRPYLIITDQPDSTTTSFNPSNGTVSTTAIFSDTRTPWENYKLKYQWWRIDKENQTPDPNQRLIDGDYVVKLSTRKTVENVVDRTQFTTFTESVDSGVIKKVGIPTEAVEVSFTISGGAGGSGGDFSSSDAGGAGGAGRVGEFKFSNSEINKINNAGSRSEYIISSGSKGNDGETGISVAGGIGGLSYDDDTSSTDIDSVFGGRGGSSGPGSSSGSGGGGGGGASIVDKDENKWMVVAGGGGGGGGASSGAPGSAGLDAGNWKEIDSSILNPTIPIRQLKPATVVNYNPKAGTNGRQDNIQYGFYIKSSSPISTVDDKTNYRIVVIWDNEVKVDTTTKLSKDGSQFYVNSGAINYYISTHKGSQLGWCNDESNLDSVCIRGDGGYVNSFDVIRLSLGFSPRIYPFDGADGAAKSTGDGGGGGAGGGGAIGPAAGGTAGTNPVASNTVDVVFKVTGNGTTGSEYIKFIEKKWYGFPVTEPSRGQTITFTRSSTTQTVTLKTGVTYDVVSSFEEGDRTSDSLRILQDFTPDANASDVIAGRSIGMNADGVGDNIQTGNENDFRDLIVSVSDGTFDVSPETVRLDDGEIVGKSIIRYTPPTAFRNQTAAAGGNGGESQYDTTKLVKTSSGSRNNGTGAVNMVIKTEQPFNDLNQATVDSVVNRNYSMRGAHPYPPSDATYKNSGYTSDLKITANYVFSWRILCQISAIDTSTNTPAETSFNNSIYTDIVDFIVVDGRDNTIVIEQIRHNDNFAILSSLNLNNGDITFERSTSGNIKETEYYSFYSNEDLEVDIQMYGGKGNDVGSFSGGEGGFSYLRLNMKKNTEYVIAGLDEYVNTPFLFKKGQLLATVGGGGDANTLGNGGKGGGVSVNGEAAFRGGAGGLSPTSALGENGVHGSASALSPISPDTKASIPNGGTTIRCSKGNLFQFGGQPSPCGDRGSAIKFGLSDGTLVTNTKEINRGFKAGYNIFNTGGRNNGAVADRGWGGCGATGGQGSDNYGGGGGAGYILPSDIDAIEKGTADIFVRSEGNSERIQRILAGRTVNTDSTIEPSKEGSGGNPISSTLGGSNGPARVVMSLAEIPSNELAEFIERPVAPVLNVSEEDVDREPDFIPLPEIVPPPPINPPSPKLSYTKTVSKGFTANSSLYNSDASGNRTDNAPFNSSTYIPVLETGSIELFVETEDIPETTFYWKVERITSNSTYSDTDFVSTTGSFTTTATTGNKCTGSFTVTPNEDNVTDFTGGKHRFRVKIYSDSARTKYHLTDSEVCKFEILDNSLSAPVATLGLNKDLDSGAFRANNKVNEGNTLTVTVDTLNIHNGQSIGWEIINQGTNSNDFDSTSGTVTVNANYYLDADGNNVAIPKNLASPSNTGTSSIQVGIEEDQTTETNRESFAFKIEYPVGSGTYITNTSTGVGDDKKSVEIIDTSQNPEANIVVPTSIEVDEGATITFSINTENYRKNESIHWKLFRGNFSSITAATTSDFDVIESTSSANALTVSASTPPATNSAGNILGTSSIDLTTINDGTTEGDEVFTLKLYRDSDHTVPVYTLDGLTHSHIEFTVKDTSLSDVEYMIRKFSGLNSNNEANEDGGEITFTMEAWNLSPDASTNSGPKKYKIYFEGTDTAAVAGDYSTNHRLSDADYQKEHDFNRNVGDLSFTRLGYTKTVGSDDYKASQDIANGYIIPYHTATGSFTPVADYIDDVEGDSNGDKEFEIGVFNNTTDQSNDTAKTFNGLSSDNRSNETFKIKNNAKPLYHFNKSRGFGVNGNYNAATSGTPELDEGKVYSFRVETTAPPGTQLWYDINKKTTTPSEDFETIDVSDLPNDSGYPIKTTYNAIYRNDGSFSTFKIDSIADKIDGVEKVRSIGFIFLKTVADKDNEDEEEFELILYNEGYGSGEVARETVKIKDTSTTSKPTISLSLESDDDTFSGNGGNAYTITVPPDTGKTITLKWTIGGDDAATDGDDTLPTGDYYESGEKLDVDGDWYEESGEASGILRPIERGTPDTTLTYKLKVENSAGSSEDSVTLTLQSQDELPPEVIYYKYEVVRLWRYDRLGTGGNQRFGLSVFGPDGPDSPSSSSPRWWPSYDGGSSNNITAEKWGEEFERKVSAPAGNESRGWRLQDSLGWVYTEQAPGTHPIKKTHTDIIISTTSEDQRTPAEDDVLDGLYLKPYDEVYTYYNEQEGEDYTGFDFPGGMDKRPLGDEHGLMWTVERRYKGETETEDVRNNPPVELSLTSQVDGRPSPKLSDNSLTGMNDHQWFIISGDNGNTHLWWFVGGNRTLERFNNTGKRIRVFHYFKYIPGENGAADNYEFHGQSEPVSDSTQTVKIVEGPNIDDFQYIV